MNILSLFDGISCGRVALERAGIRVDKYYASEVDKHAIKIAIKNFPDTVQLGDVRLINVNDLPKIDLLIGGSPCQSFSVAGDGTGFEGKSGLFYEYLRILNELKALNPNLKFLLENVKMKKVWQDQISNMVGVQPIEINSALVSAQNRKRLYWTNIEGVTQPEDRGIILRDILEEGVTDREKSFCLDANYHKGGNLEQYFNKGRRQLVFQINPSTESGGKQPYMQNRVYHIDGKSVALTQFAGRLNIGDFSPFALTETRTEEAKRIRREHKQKFGKDFSPRRAKELTPRTDEKSNCLTTSLTSEHIIVTDVETSDIYWRKLTPIECERLQTLPDNYTEGISNTQRYKALGNGWTVDVIAHIFSFL